MAKADSAFSRAAKIEDTTIGWRFVNPLMKAKYGIDSMPETAENVAAEFKVSRADQDAFALRSQQRAAAAIAAGRLAEEIVPVTLPAKKGDPVVVDRDEHPRETTLEALAKLKGVVRPDGTVTAGNASGVNDGACAMLLASEDAARRHGLTPRARIVAAAAAGVAPRIMGFGPAPATRKVLAQAGLTLADIDVIELNEAFAAQALAVTRDLGLADDAAARQSERRRHRARPSARRERRAARDHGALPAAPHRRPLRAVHDVHRRRPGHRDDHRARLADCRRSAFRRRVARKELRGRPSPDDPNCPPESRRRRFRGSTRIRLMSNLPAPATMYRALLRHDPPTKACSGSACARPASSAGRPAARARRSARTSSSSARRPRRCTRVIGRA